MAKHAGTAHGYARDIGAAKNRILAGKPRYGKHGQYVARHAGRNESMPLAVVRDWVRGVKRRPAYGLRGVPFTHPIALGMRVATATRRVS